MKKHEAEQKKQQFLELRVVQGKSFDSISEELNISKKTRLRFNLLFCF